MAIEKIEITDNETISLQDPYVLDPAKVQNPPTGWRNSLKFLGPGMITSAAVVGSGELLLATALGAEAGFMFLWLIILSTFVKVAVQIQLARWTISTGEVAIEGYDKVGPRLFGRGWISYIGLLQFIQFLLGQAGVLGAAALSFSMLIPIGGQPLSWASITFWVAVCVLITVLIHRSNRYSVIEKVSTFLVIVITAMVVAMVFGIQFTPFSWGMDDLAYGMSFNLTPGLMGIALAVFGMTGVGGGEITSYSYWCIEKGYAAWTGPHEDNQAWADRANGWIKVMEKDAWLSWAVYTASTLSFYILGAAVLHPQGLIPSGTDVIDTISRIFTDTLGKEFGTIFLFGAGVALLKTILANAPGFARQMTHNLAIFGVLDWSNMEQRSKWMRTLVIALPIAWGVLAAFIQSPLALVTFAGISNAIYLMSIVIATMYLSKKIDKRVRGGKLWTTYLWISAIAIFTVGALSLLGLS